MNTVHELPAPHPWRTFFKRAFAVTLALSGIAFILWLDSWFMDHADMPKLGRDMSYGLLVLVGFLTSFHCVGMCGPLIVGYTAKNAGKGYKSYASHLLYGVGKTLSYTLIGALFGAFGSFVAFTPRTQGAVGIAAGVFLILFGLHMLEVFPVLRHFQFKMPPALMRFIGKEYRKHHNPFFIGLLNGLMIICGPLQAMYVMAAGTGSFTGGASILFFFAVGTLPLLLGFGFLTSLLSKNLTPKLLKASGAIVMALGAIMLNRGLAVTGSGADFNTLVARVAQELAPTVAEAPLSGKEQIIRMDVLKNRFSPNKFTLRKGVPVKWVIDGKELNECNKAIVVPQYGLEIELHAGEQTVEFTPKESGVVPWSCWMGMIPGTFIVVDDRPAPKAALAAETPPAAQPAPQADKGPDGERLVREFEAVWRGIVSYFRGWFTRG
ncbi:sulfite exporter TauE/SafE family protein [Candidatus Methylomicrobium oryzae]|uniref:sulfite exporter TauE/SafE family protein n=1 Tax=Candidatus Methylomicrobium oryzae TaxID=2802053 RepID=UPI001F351020|nr:sulfite exporter TauE/SafE family protein [Methylomicrobium sp. RS1]